MGLLLPAVPKDCLSVCWTTACQCSSSVSLNEAVFKCLAENGYRPVPFVCLRRACFSCIGGQEKGKCCVVLNTDISAYTAFVHKLPLSFDRPDRAQMGYWCHIDAFVNMQIEYKRYGHMAINCHDRELPQFQECAVVLHEPDQRMRKLGSC